MDLLDSKLLVSNLTSCLEDSYEGNQQKALQLLHASASHEVSYNCSIIISSLILYNYSIFYNIAATINDK